MAHYQILLSLHIIAIISWMAGILYLYRLLIYAKERGEKDPIIHELLSLMSRRLWVYITRPALIASWVLGLGLVSLNPSVLSGGWFHLKFLAIVLLTASSFYAGMLVVQFESKARPLPSSKSLRILNEVPTLLMILIVFMVILKPWVRV